MNPVKIYGENIFAETTSYTINEGAGIIMKKKSSLVLDNKSSLTLKPNSWISLERGAKIIVLDSCSLTIHPEAKVSGKGKIILMDGSFADMRDHSVKVKVKSSNN